MNRRTLLVAIGGSVLAAPLWVAAQPTEKMWHIGYLTPGIRPPDGAPPAGLRQALRDLGYVEGRNPCL